MLSTTSPATLTPALKCILKISSDDPNLLDSPALNHPLNTILPLMTSYLSHPSPPVTKLALEILSTYIPTFPNAMASSMNDILTALSSIASHQDPGVRKRVCEILGSFTVHRPMYVSGRLPGIAEFMVGRVVDGDRDVRMKATEFWMNLLHPGSYGTEGGEEGKVGREVWEKQGCMERVVPMLLGNVVYTEEEREGILERNEEEDEGRNVKPIFHKGRGRGEEEDDEDDEEEGFDDGEDGSWSLRKASAQTLDFASAVSEPDKLLGILLPELQKGLSDQDPWVREAAILSLGAIGGSTATGRKMEAYLPQIYPFLCQQLTAPLPQLAAVAAWAMSRYVGWVCYIDESGGERGKLGRHVGMLVNAGMGKSGKVRSAVVGSLAAAVEVAGGEHIEPLLNEVSRML